jgi:hypothetical protein
VAASSKPYAFDAASSRLGDAGGEEVGRVTLGDEVGRVTLGDEVGRMTLGDRSRDEPMAASRRRISSI